MWNWTIEIKKQQNISVEDIKKDPFIPKFLPNKILIKKLSNGKIKTIVNMLY